MRTFNRAETYLCETVNNDHEILFVIKSVID